MQSKPLTATLLTLAVSVAITGNARAIADADNLGQWDKPTNIGPDKECPGFLVNLGPTGARAILKETSFVVKHVFPKSPADGQLRIDDEITGVNGKPFTKHTFGKCYGMEPGAGYEGPIMDMGNAIEDSEGKDGTLTLDVIRDGKPAKVDDQARSHRPLQRHLPEELQEVGKTRRTGDGLSAAAPRGTLRDRARKRPARPGHARPGENEGGGNPGHGMEQTAGRESSGPGIRPTKPSSSPNISSRPATSACSRPSRKTANASTSPR